jgi:hypothetical protein
MLYVTLHQTPRIFERQRRPGADAVVVADIEMVLDRPGLARTTYQAQSDKLGRVSYGSLGNPDLPRGKNHRADH